jgi:hypothetical protein
MADAGAVMHWPMGLMITGRVPADEQRNEPINKSIAT